MQEEQEQKQEHTIFDNLDLNTKKHVILIDGSYYCFTKYYSTLKAWKTLYQSSTNTNDKLSCPFEPISNEEFVENFKTKFVYGIKNIAKNVNINVTNNEDPLILVGKDCKRENIWRNELHSEYKGTRNSVRDKDFKGGPFFKMVYETKLFQEAGASQILSHPVLEADDCIAISVKYILEKYPNIIITIITSDTDYLQLVEPRVTIYNASYKNISENKSSLKDPKMDLFCKIVMGDTSDNIKSVLTKCGPKTALKCFYDANYFEDRLKEEDAYEKFLINMTLIDFNCIPKVFKDEFIHSL